MHSTLREILEHLDGVAPFPHVAVRVLELSSDEDVGAPELIEVIATDAPTVAKVLRMANSALMGVRVEVRSLQDAGTRLGTHGLVELVMTSCASGLFDGLGSSTARSNRSLWTESVVNALAARLVARMDGGVDPQVAYTLGLLQNIGHLVLDRFLRRERDRVQAEIDLGADALEAERRVLGLSHADLGARLLERWNFPESLVDATRWHHEPARARLDARLAGVAELAEALGYELLVGESVGALCYASCERAGRSAGLGLERLPAVRQLLAEELEKRQLLVGA